MANKIVQGMREAVAYAKGDDIDVRKTLVQTPTEAGDAHGRCSL